LGLAQKSLLLWFKKNSKMSFNNRFWYSLLLLLGFVFQQPLWSQKIDSVLFTYGTDKVFVDEFKYVYEKNNPNAADLYSQKSLEEYLNLYINFKLKVKAAKELGLDTGRSFQSELEGYRKQLAQSYMSDHNVTENLMAEAYERSKKELKTSHILLALKADASPADTLKAYQKLMGVRDEILKGLDFADAARKYSEDPSVKDNGGSLGYISAFSTIYEFETGAYNTPIGKISKPVRSKFGYHLIKVEAEREARGLVKIAQILLKVPKFGEQAQQEKIKKTTDSLYALIKGGASFEDLANKYSEDKSEFEDAAFALNTIGQISKPVLTKYGWHILKLTGRKNIGSYKDSKNDIKRKVEKDARSAVAKKVFIESLQKDYNFSEIPGAKEQFTGLLSDSISQGNWTANAYKNNRTPLFNVSTKAKLINEYHDGMLLFEITNQKVWEKAIKDTLGLKEYFEKNKDKYVWGERVDAQIITCASAKDADAIKKKMGKKRMSKEELTTTYNKEGLPPVINKIEEGLYEKEPNDYIHSIAWEKGVSRSIVNADNTVTFVVIHDLLPATNKKLEDAKGYIISDYQGALEQGWVAVLRHESPVVIDKMNLARLIKK
jgi:peptidyl-prolyl cis-trans isomerase SurA